MKIFKKVTSVCTALLCAIALMVSGAVAVYAESEVDENFKATLIMSAEGLTDAIVKFEDEQIDSLIEESNQPVIVDAMLSWKAAKKEVGALEAEQTAESEFTHSGHQFTVSVPRDFEKMDAKFVFVFDEEANPTSITVDVKYPMSVTLQRAGLNTIMGIGTVFLMLIFLSFVIYLFKYVPGLVEGKKKAAPEAAPAPVAVAAPVEEEVVDDGELIAVIAAAIAASEGTSTDGFVVRSIRKVNRGRR